MFRFSPQALGSWRARFTPNLTFVFCTLNPKDPNCFGLRSWLRNNLAEIQTLNPGLNFQVFENSFGEPLMVLNFSQLDQRMVRLAGVTEPELDDIFDASITYSMNHVNLDRFKSDEGVDPLIAHTINNFSYTDSFLTKVEVFPPADRGQHQGGQLMDDPGQKPLKLPRNANIKIMP